MQNFKNFISTPTLGEILREEFMTPLDISDDKLAKDIAVSSKIIKDILNNKQKITPDISLRLGIYFGVSERYFLNLQNDIDIRNIKLAISDELKNIKPVKILKAI
ncbi:MAG: HigA family addiction module antidote protein [Synergistaceae bacterium]|nr:HigA family addiction module antidote protein [Synergistaceae bacterium]MBQ6908821.1 HigA family addiction module antidote protein [Synergistaceae bacterium]MBQ7569461.1 HigA family addiction module antidote protein [Synergistaceae bacterium]MBQ9581267.1 HigA family addiction module antidote protein [Synergistaceae bacterium]MBQ9897011.1 HigA family addiction module antidote protein [Synergistaceae bacterium]